MSVVERDAVVGLSELSDESCHLVFTDPPYASGKRDASKSVRKSQRQRGQRWADAPIRGDWITGAGWNRLMRDVLIESYRVLCDGHCVAVWSDFVQLPNLMALVESCAFRVSSLVVWDKGSIGMGTPFRRQHELVVVAAKGVPTQYRADVPDVLQAKRPSNEWHPTPKPTGLQASIIETLTPPGATVVDPFAGAGSVGVSCGLTGREFIGFEIDPVFVHIANDRLRQTTLDMG